MALTVSAILVAAGSGSRLGAAVPKAIVEIGGVPLVARSAAALLAAPRVTALIVAAPPGFENHFRTILERHLARDIPLHIVSGGAERQDSVSAGLAIAGDPDLIAIHDAARPFIEAATIENAIDSAQRDGAAVVGIPASDTVKQVDEHGWITGTPPRAHLWQVQTPQIFRTTLLRSAHERARSDEVLATDDSALVERLGVAVRMVRGSAENRKITTPDDLRWAEWFVASRSAPR